MDEIDDPVVVYDVMCETANRLAAFYAERVTEGGGDDPAVIAIIAIDAEVEAVPTRDLAAQKTKTAELHQRYLRLTQSEADSTRGGAVFVEPDED